MADQNTQATQSSERLIKTMQAQERASDQLVDAMKELGDKALGVLTEQVKTAAKQAGILSDKQLSLIKNSKDLAVALKLQEEQLDKLIQTSTEAYHAELDKIKSSYDFQKIGKKYQDQILSDAEKKHELELREIIDRQNLHEALNDQTAVAVNGAKHLDVFTNFINRGSKALAGWVAKTFTVENAMKDLTEAVTQSITELNKATAVGLQDSLFAINKGAMHLNMTFDEFSDVLAKNRDIVRQLGGGTQGVQAFTGVLDEASKGLKFMGRDGTFATAKFIESMKTMGNTVQSKKFDKSISSMQTHFTQFAALYGDNYDTYSDLIETQYKSETLQSRLNNLDDAGRLALQEEIIARTENIKNLGLSNDQIKMFNDKISELYDPHKVNVTEKIKGAEISKSYLEELAATSGNEALKAALPKLMDYLEYTKGASDEQIKKRQSEMGKEFETVGAAQADLTQQQEKLANEGKIGEASTVQMTPNILRNLGGGTGENVAAYGTALYQAQQQKRNLTPGQIEQGKQAAADQVAGNVDLYTQTIKEARDIQQSYNAIMENSITKGLKGLAEGVGALLLNFTKLGKVIETITKMGIGGGGAGAGAGVAEGVAGGGAASLIPGVGNTVKSFASKALPFARGATGLGLMLHSEGAGVAAGQPNSDEWTQDELTAMNKKQSKIAAPATDTATAAPTTPGETAPAVSTQSHTDDPLLKETKKQTDLLSQIVQNTTIAFKPTHNSAMYKSSPGEVANKING
jgi:hypothetical protein